MVDTIIIGMEELLLFVPFGGSMHCKRSWFHEVCDKSFQPCMLAHGNRTRCVPARLSQCRYLHLPSAYYYIILALAATGYAIFLFLVYRLKCRIHNSARSRDGETSADCMNSDQ